MLRPAKATEAQRRRETLTTRHSVLEEVHLANAKPKRRPESWARPCSVVRREAARDKQKSDCKKASGAIGSSKEASCLTRRDWRPVAQAIVWPTLKTQLPLRTDSLHVPLAPNKACPGSSRVLLHWALPHFCNRGGKHVWNASVRAPLYCVEGMPDLSKDKRSLKLS